MFYADFIFIPAHYRTAEYSRSKGDFIIPFIVVLIVNVNPLFGVQFFIPCRDR